jgi:hypothetical protein
LVAAQADSHLVTFARHGAHSVLWTLHLQWGCDMPFSVASQFFENAIGTVKALKAFASRMSRSPPYCFGFRYHVAGNTSPSQ